MDLALYLTGVRDEAEDATPGRDNRLSSRPGLRHALSPRRALCTASLTIQNVEGRSVGSGSSSPSTIRSPLASSECLSTTSESARLQRQRVNPRLGTTHPESRFATFPV